MNNVTAILVIVTMLWCAACTSVQHYGRYYQPRSQYAKCDIYYASPQREFEEIAKIDTDYNDVSKLQEKARELGADGVIVLGAARQGGYAQKVGQSYLYSSRGIGLSGIAIKYK